MEIWKLQGARQAHYGVKTDLDGQWLTLRESFGECDLSVEMGTGVELVETLPDITVADNFTLASSEMIFDALAHLEGWPDTWAETQEARRRDEEEE